MIEQVYTKKKKHITTLVVIIFIILSFFIGMFVGLSSSTDENVAFEFGNV